MDQRITQNMRTLSTLNFWVIQLHSSNIGSIASLSRNFQDFFGESISIDVADENVLKLSSSPDVNDVDIGSLENRI